MKTKDKAGLGTFLVILAGICWGVISLFINELGDYGYSSLEMLGIRAWLAVIIMFVCLLVMNRKLLVISLKDIWMFIGTGVISLTFFSYCYFTTIVNSGAAVAVVLLYTSPIFVMLMSAVVFKERITIKKIVALVMTFGGCVLVAGLIGGAGGLTPMALLTGLGAGIGYALYSIFAGVALKKYSSLTVTFYTFLFSGLSLFFLVNPVQVVSKLEMPAMPYFLGIAVICTVLPYITYTIGLGQMEAGKAAVLVTVEPLVGTIIGLAVFKENVDAYKIIGIVLIFAAVILLSLPAGEAKEDK